MPNLPSLATCCVSLELRPLPSLGVTRVRRYYEPLRRSLGPACPSRESGWSCVRPPRRPVPCCTSLPLICMPSSLPRRNSWVHSSLASPEATAFPVIQAGRLPHRPFRGLLDVHSHYGLHIRQVTYVTLYTRGFSRRLPVRLLRLLPAGATVRRVGFAPTGRPCLS